MYITPYTYYENDGNLPEDLNWGSYQFVSLPDIVRNFQSNYVGQGKLINRAERSEIIFHAKMAIKELYFDAFKQVKVLELDLNEDIQFVLPPDYVGWVRVSVYKNGVLRPLQENPRENSASAYLQSQDGRILFNESGEVLEPGASQIEMDRISGAQKTVFNEGGESFDGIPGYDVDGTYYYDMVIGHRYGRDSSKSYVGPSFRVDRNRGVINFSSDMAGELCILEYVTDGMENGDDALVTVNKFFEKYLYAYISYHILESSVNTPEYVVRRFRRRHTAELRNAKIRMSKLDYNSLLMPLRSRQNWDK